jgi:multiple sugar transport system substrate-binding protein
MSNLLELTIPYISEKTDSYLHQVLSHREAAHTPDHHDFAVQVTSIPWDTLWHELVNVGLYKHGADVSQIGTTWIGGLMAMDALRPYSTTEIAHLGGEAAFLPAAWQANLLKEQPNNVWAIPLVADPRVIFYRRDLLEKAGVNEAEAFKDINALDETLERLRASGIKTPWAVPTCKTRNTLHYIASWIWGAGGDFTSEDGRQLLFAQAESLSGICAYFNLHRFMPRRSDHLGEQEVLHLLADGEIAVTVCGPWGFRYLQGTGQLDKITRIRLALPPGPAFVGGLCIVIWKHVSYQKAPAAVDLVNSLIQPEIEANYAKISSYLPTRLDLLNQPPYTTQPEHQVFAQALKSGRPHPPFMRWGLIEDRLSSTLDEIWANLYLNPDQNVSALVTPRLVSLARRFETALTG